jgi:chromosome segregation ATPase
MTQQKHPINATTVGETIFQFWRNGQNATVESVMKALGTTHRQKVNDLMIEGRACAGEMIQTREAESKLGDDFPVEAFGAIRDWAKRVAEVRLNDWEDALKARELKLHEERQDMQIQLQAVGEQNKGLEIQLAALQNQLAELKAKSEQERIAAQAKCEGLEQVLLDTRERAGQAEARLDVTASALKVAQTDLAEQKQHIHQVTTQRDELNQTNKELVNKTAQLAQQLDSHRAQSAERDRKYQQRESNWLAERDERIRIDTEKTSQIHNLETTLQRIQNDCVEIKKRYQNSEQEQSVLKVNIQKLEQTNSAVQAQLNMQRAELEKKDRRLIELERQNAELQMKLAQVDKDKMK